MEHYNFKQVEKKWQKYWEENNSFYFEPNKDNKKNYYMLEMFPYPSGQLHIGHVRNFSIGDVMARFKVMQGYNVLHPMGADAFGLPAENAAIKHNIHPHDWTEKNIEEFKKSMKSLGFYYDYSRFLATCFPEYYGKQQEIFIDLYKKGLIYRKESYVNWDPVDQTVLANEQVVNGRGWRSGAVVERKKLNQWFFKITHYAEELLQDIDKLDKWAEKVKLMQKNWIGKSSGAVFKMKIKDEKYEDLLIYTTRPDTLFGASFVGISSNHPLTEELVKNNKDLADFCEECKKTSVDEATTATMEKKGFDTGLKAINPFTGEELPIYVANFILMDYGTGAIFGCPAHDERDYEFAKKYGLKIKQVVAPSVNSSSSLVDCPLESPSSLVDCPFESPSSLVDCPLKSPSSLVDCPLKSPSSLVDFPLESPSSLAEEGLGWRVNNSQTKINKIRSTPYIKEDILQKSRELRSNMTNAEQLLWYFIRKEQLNFSFRRQYSIDNKYIADFVCLKKKLIIELDGGQHNEDNNIKYDKERTEYLNKQGFKVLRFWNNDVFNNLFDVLNTIWYELNEGDDYILPSIPTLPPQGRKDFQEENLQGRKDFQEENPQGRKDFQKENPQGRKDCLVNNPQERMEFQNNNSQEINNYSKNILPFTEEGYAINSDFLNGLTTKEAKEKAISELEKLGIGEKKVNYRLRDWGFSRQRYWGCPIPVVYCEDCGVALLDKKDLPLELPRDVVFDGKGNPLEKHPTWKYTKCPHCGKPAIRETDTMDTFVDSSWYFMRYPDLCKDKPINNELCNEVLPIDLYVGGIEHATMHLIYFRFFTKALRDCGYFNIDEPAKGMFNQGMVCHKAYRGKNTKDWCFPWNVQEKDGKFYNIETNEELSCEGVIKMSKSKSNVVDNAKIVDAYGADAVRMFVLSDSPADKDFEWTEQGIEGCWKYINKFYRMVSNFKEVYDINNINYNNNIIKETHKTIKFVSEYLENLEFNKAIARIREFTNFIEKLKVNSQEEKESYYFALVSVSKLFLPFAPHLCSELLERLNIKDQNWPTFNEEFTVENTTTIAIQVNGKLRATVEIQKDLAKEQVEVIAKEQENIKKYLENAVIKKVIVVPNKLVNIVI